MQLLVSCVYAVNGFLETVLPQIISYVAIAIFIFTSNHPLLPEYVVLLIGNYFVICSQFDNLNKALVWVSAGYVSISRMQKYLVDESAIKEKEKINVIHNAECDGINLRNVDATYCKVNKKLWYSARVIQEAGKYI
jgi:hypothetical protein